MASIFLSSRLMIPQLNALSSNGRRKRPGLTRPVAPFATPNWPPVSSSNNGDAGRTRRSLSASAQTSVSLSL